MSSSSFYCSRKIAYVSLSANQESHDPNLKLVQDYCRTLPYEVDVFAEEVEPTNAKCPLFEDILERIRRGEVSLLIVPSLNHILGFQKNAKKDLLRFLAEHQVNLITLAKDRGPLLTILGGII